MSKVYGRLEGHSLVATGDGVDSVQRRSEVLPRHDTPGVGTLSWLLGNPIVLLGNTEVLLGNTIVLLGNTRVLLGNTTVVLLGNTSVAR